MSNPKELAGDVGAFRGLTHNISGSVGIAVGTAIAVSLLGVIVAQNALNSPAFTPELVEQVNFDNVQFVTSDQLVVDPGGDRAPRRPRPRPPSRSTRMLASAPCAPR